MDNTNEGTQPNPELAQAGTPGPVELATQTPPAASAGPAPELAALQSELAAVREERARIEQQFKDTQAAYTQSRQQIAALTGAQQAQPKGDPLAPHLEYYVKRGINPDDAKILAERDYATAQENAAIKAQLAGLSLMQGQSQVGFALNQAFSMDPGALADPEVANAVRGYLGQNAQSGQLDSINPEMALNLAYIEIGRRAAAARNGQQQAPPRQVAGPQPQQFNINGMYGPQGGFAPPAQRQQAPAATPEQLQLRAELAERMKPKA